MNLKKEDLIEGKIYKVYQQKEFKFIVKKDNGNNYICLNPRKLENPFFSKGFNFSPTSYDYELATPEESYWLEECIKANKFIPKEEALKSFKQEFKAGDYIVIKAIKACKKDRCYPDNYCFKQRVDFSYLMTKLDNEGSNSNGWAAYDFDKKVGNDWRYATKEEIAEYDRLGKPYDVTTLRSKSEIVEDKPKSLVGRYVKALVDYPASGNVRIGEIGIVIREINSNNLCVDFPSQSNYRIDKWHFDKKRVELLPEDYKPESTDLHNGFKIGSLYKADSKELAYYVGLSKTNNFPIFELKDPVGTSIPDNNEFPDNYISKGSKTYWRYKGLDSKFICEEIIEEWIPKVGDWIVITKSKENWNGHMDKFDKSMYQITKVIDNDMIEFKDSGFWIWRFSQKHFRKALDHEIPKCSTSVGEIKYSDTSGLVVDNTKPMEANWSIGTTTKFEDVPLSGTITVNGQSMICDPSGHIISGYINGQIIFSKYHIPKTIKPITLDSKPNDLILGVKPNYPKQIKKIVL